MPRRRSSSSSSESDSELGKRKRSVSFSERYPELAEQAKAVRADVRRLKTAVRDTVTPLVVGDMYSFVWDLSETFCKLVQNFREENDLSDVTLPLKDISDEIYASVLSDQSLDFADDVADEVPLFDMDKSKSFEELIQDCYDTTKTRGFRKAVENVVEHPGAFMHALKTFKEDRDNKNMENFLKAYSKRLYNRHMKDVEITISF